MATLKKLIPGGEVRMVMKGDKTTYKGETKEAQRDYVMIKLVSTKNPIFIDQATAYAITEIFNDEDFERKYQWFKKV